MLPHLCRRLHAFPVTILVPQHCNCIRIASKSTVRLLVNDASTRHFLHPPVLRIKCGVGFKTWATPQVEEKLRRKDGLSSDYNLIYRAPMINYMMTAQGLCIGLTILYFALLINEYVSGDTFTENKDSYFGLTIGKTDKLLFITSFFIFNGFIFSFISRYALRMYMCKDGTYKSIFLGVFPWNKKKLSFRKGEIMAKPSFSFLPWKDSQFQIGRKKVIIIEQYFRMPADFNEMFKS